MAINKDTGLTDKQEKFCQEYLIDLNGTQAAIRAGYSKKTAKQVASENLTKLDVIARLRELNKKIEERTEISQEWVRKRFKEISDRCMTAEPVMIYDGENWVESGEYKFDSSGANKATEMLGKHLGFFEKDNNSKVVVYNTDVSKEEAAEIAKALNDKY